MQFCIGAGDDMDWDDARVFLAIYRRGTLRGAADALRIDQATAGRRLAALEGALGARLFLRTPKGYAPTAAGEQAFEAMVRMEDGANALLRRMQGLDDRLEGAVSLACTDTAATVFLMPALRRVHDRHPDILVRLVASTRLSSLTHREADLAVRSVRPTEPDLIVRHLGRRRLGLYAASDYLAARGVPERGTGLAGHDTVIYAPEVYPGQRDFLCTEPVDAARVALEVNTGMMMAEAVAAGIGIGELPHHLAALYPGLVRIWPDREDPYDMWLVMHDDLNRTARVRAVAEAIVEAFEEEAAAAAATAAVSPAPRPRPTRRRAARRRAARPRR
jgi:DNA-binding transcriptional LysR family regulator